jgi:hypothetical protein
LGYWNNDYMRKMTKPYKLSIPWDSSVMQIGVIAHHSADRTWLGYWNNDYLGKVTKPFKFSITFTSMHFVWSEMCGVFNC